MFLSLRRRKAFHRSLFRHKLTVNKNHDEFDSRKLCLTSKSSRICFQQSAALSRPIYFGKGTRQLLLLLLVMLSVEEKSPLMFIKLKLLYLQLIQQPLLLLTGLYIPSMISCSLIR